MEASTGQEDGRRVADVNAVDPDGRLENRLLAIDEHLSVLFELDHVAVRADRHRFRARRHRRQGLDGEIHGLDRRRDTSDRLKNKRMAHGASDDGGTANAAIISDPYGRENETQRLPFAP